ncbi:Acyl-protein thioesterase 1, partial [Termitomyces sp. J132]
PLRPRRIFCGHSRPSWFDVTRTPPGPNEFDERGVVESIGVIENIILSQVYIGIDSRRIILAGFGQGAALGMMVALSTLHHLGGVVSLSGWIPPPARYVRYFFNDFRFSVDYPIP